jgi:hypothetical protein
MSIIDYLKENLVSEDVSLEKLNQWYEKFNRELFDGELPTVPIKLINSRIVGGQVKATINRATNEIKITNLEISNFFNSDDDRLKGILVHEMIHVYFLSINSNEGHGYLFMRKLNDLQKKVDFTISLKDTVTDLDVGDHIKSKLYDVMIIKMYDIESVPSYVISVMKKGFLKTSEYSFVRRNGKIEPVEKTSMDELIYKNDDRVIFHGCEIYFLQSNDKELFKFQVSSKLKTIKYYKIDSTKAERIIKEGSMLLFVDKDYFKNKEEYKDYV